MYAEADIIVIYTVANLSSQNPQTNRSSRLPSMSMVFLVSVILHRQRQLFEVASQLAPYFNALQRQPRKVCRQNFVNNIHAGYNLMQNRSQIEIARA